MKKVMLQKVFILILTMSIMISLSSCANFDFAETGNYIVTPKEAVKLIDQDIIVVDVRSSEEYGLNHVSGSVNIPMSEITVSEPYANMLPDSAKIEEVMSGAGITAEDQILVYDDADNMQAARFQWSLNMYSNFNVKVVSGGFEALKNQGVELTSEKTVLEPAVYTSGEYQKSLIVTLDYVKALINMPDEKTVIIDTRSDEEYYAGTIPGSYHKEYIWNMYPNGEFKSPRDIQSTYIESGITPDMKIVLFCKTSVRAAQTYTALMDAGYNDVRIYDGAWLEYFDKENPQLPSGDITPDVKDAS